MILKLEEETKLIQVEKDIEFPIEHSFIDFDWLIIGDKIRFIDDHNHKANRRYDHLYYAELIWHQHDNIDLLSTYTMKKIIDFQFSIASRFMEKQFLFYMIFYVMPYSVTLVGENEEVQLICLKVCVIPQIVLMIIKMIQFYA